MESVGFSGTRRGMTDAQILAVKQILDLRPVSMVRHGGCIGADREFDGLSFKRRKIRVERNKDIVADSTFLIAAPKESKEVRRSGTWATIRYARKAGKTVYIILPDGTVKIE